MEPEAHAHSETVPIATTSPAASRSRLYKLLSLAFTFPDKDFYAALREGSLSTAFADGLRRLPGDHSMNPDLVRGLTPSEGEYDHFESEFIRLFDVGGGGGPPCPLYGGEYTSARMKSMEDALRFYDFFGLKLSQGAERELPDHITVQFEFMHFLAYQEVGADLSVRPSRGDHTGSPLRGIDSDPIQRSLRLAQADFLDRHLAKWLPRFTQRLSKETTLPFFHALAGTADAFTRLDLIHLRSGRT